MAEAYAQTQVERLGNIALLLGTQCAQTSIEKFAGDPKKFQSWIKSIDKYILVVGSDAAGKKTFALQSAEGPVSEFLVRYYYANPEATWSQVHEQLKSRFGDVIDSQHAMQMLRQTRQNSGETIQSFSERVLCMAEQSYPDRPLTDPIIERQLVDCLVDGLTDSSVARKLMREDPTTFQSAVQIAVHEQNLTKKFELRNRPIPKWKPTKPVRQSQNIQTRIYEEPMEVDSFRGNCYRCGKSGHIAVSCKARARQVPSVHEVNQGHLVCYKCGQAGHVLAKCQGPGNPATGRCWACGQRGHKQRECTQPAVQQQASSQRSLN